MQPICLNPDRSIRRVRSLALVAAAIILSLAPHRGTAAGEVAPPASGLVISAPLDYQVTQRQSGKTTPIRISLQLKQAAQNGDRLEFRLEGATKQDSWKRLATLTRDQVGVETQIGAPSGGWYALQLRIRRKGDVIASAQVDHVGVGEVFVISGQSNSANHGDERQKTQTRRVSAFYKGRWQLADDPQPGASGGGGSFVPPFADAMVSRLNVPVGIVATGAGGTSVREWLPKGTRFPHPPTVEANVKMLPNGEWESKGGLYDNLVTRMKSLGPHGFRAVLWHQGESDANQADKTRTLPGDAYRSFLQKVIQDSSRDIGWTPPWFVALVSYHTPTDTGSEDIRNAQKALWRSGVALEGPDSDALVGAARDADGKGIHFSGPGLREHGRRWSEKVLPWLETQLAHPKSP